MPIYNYFCEKCDKTFDEMLKVADYQTPQPCPSCKELAPRMLEAPGLNFPGDGWMTKNLRVEKQMRENRNRVGRRSNQRKLDGALPSMVPNVGGEETKTWSEAARLAQDKGLDPTGYVEKALEKTP